MMPMASTRHPRSRTGCWICRLRKKKCDETRPTCQQCRNLRIQCDGYGVAQPAWMRDVEAAQKKKNEIRLQIGKRGRRRRKALARLAEDQVAEERPSDKEDIREDEAGLGNSSAVKAGGRGEGTIGGNGDGDGKFVFEMTNNGIELLKPFHESPERYAASAIALLDSPHPPAGCFRCPVKNSLVRSSHPVPGYGILDGRTGKPILQDVKSGVILVPAPPPLWKPAYPIDFSIRTKDEEIVNDDYEAIISPLLSLTTKSHHASLSPAELEDPALVPPIRLVDSHEIELMANFLRNVLPLTYTFLSAAEIRENLLEVVIPLITTNSGVLKACLGTSARHLAKTGGKSQECVKALFEEAWGYHIDCIQDLQKKLKEEGVSEQSLAVVLALTSYEVHSLPFSSNWKPHLTAAIECLVQLDLLNKPTQSASSKFLMSRVIWLDILSALTLGRAPQLWANYREILSRPVHERAFYGLLDMTGCDDTVMFLVSEVMCVEDYKFQTLGNGMISWARGSKRAIELDGQLRDRDLPVAIKLPPSPEPPFPPPPPPEEDDIDDDNDIAGSSPSFSSASSPISTPTLPKPSPQIPEKVPNDHSTSTESSSPTHTPMPLIFPETVSEVTPESPETQATPGTASSRYHSIPPELMADQGMIVKATTAAFRTATRIHLWSIGLGFYPRLNFFRQLLEELIIMVALIPLKLSRTVAWPLLVGGCMATEQKDREFFVARCVSGCGGGLASIARIMKEVWKRRDETDRVMGIGCGQEVHWRNVMKEEDLEILLL